MYITDGGLVEPLLQPSRIFKKRIIQNKELFGFTAGHHNPLTKTVYMGVPISDSETETATEISGQMVFNYSLRNITLNTIDYGWSVNTQVPATAWTRITSEDYFASSSGKVFRLRTERGETKYSDERTGIPFKLTTRFIDSQDPISSKTYRSFFFQLGKDTDSSVQVSYAPDFAESYTPIVLIDVTKVRFGTAPFGTTYWGCDNYVEVFRKTPDAPRITQVSLRLENDTVDQNVEVYGIFLESTLGTSKTQQQVKGPTTP
jgi:hypothetical protein